MARASTNSRMADVQSKALEKLSILGGKLLGEDDIVFQGTRFIIPQHLSLKEAGTFILKRAEDEEGQVQFSRSFEYRPMDGARATAQALKKAFGFTMGKTLYDFFGNKHLPQFIDVRTGPHHDDVEQVPWGAMQIPALPGSVLHLGQDRHKDFGLVFQIVVECPRKFRWHIEGLFKLIDQELRENSIYKGKAIDGADQFIDCSVVNPLDVVYTETVQRRLEGDVWAFVKHAELLKQFGQDGKYAVLFEGPYGCLAADTELTVNRGGNARRYSIKNLVEKFNGTSADRRSWDPTIPTKVQYRDTDGVLRLTTVTGAWCSGVKQTYVVTVEDGRSIRATDEHPFWTPDGWKRLDQLTVGSMVYTRAPQATPEGTARQRKQRAAYHSRRAPGHPYRKGNEHVAEHRLVIEAHENGFPDVKSFLERVATGEHEGLKFLDPTQWHVHHLNEDTLDNRIENLEKMSHREHATLHSVEFGSNVLFKTRESRVVSIDPYGEEMTYDIEVEAAEHNFIANGFVVHNTGKSLAALLTAQIATAHGWTFLMCRPGVDDLTTTLEMARMYQPAVVFAEDVDTTAGAQSRASIERHLDLLDGIKQKGLKLVTIFTTNHAEQIHKGMLRPGRIGAVISIGAMDRAGVEKLCRRVLGDVLADDVDFDEVYNRTEGYMPAFIREVFDRAIRYAICLNDGELSTIDTEAICLAADGLRDQYRLMEEAPEDTITADLSHALEAVVSRAVDGVEVRNDSDYTEYTLAAANNGR